MTAAEDAADRAAFAEIADTFASMFQGEPNRKLLSLRKLRWVSRNSGTLMISGTKIGRWRDHEAGEGGGALHLVQRELGCDKAGAVKWLCDQNLTDAVLVGWPSRFPAPRRRASCRDRGKPRLDRPASCRLMAEFLDPLHLGLVAERRRKSAAPAAPASSALTAYGRVLAPAHLQVIGRTGPTVRRNSSKLLQTGFFT